MLLRRPAVFRSCLGFAPLAAVMMARSLLAVDATVNPGTDRAPISPSIYGTNSDLPAVTATLRR